MYQIGPLRTGAIYCPNTSATDLLIICKSSSLQWKIKKLVHGCLLQWNVIFTSWLHKFCGKVLKMIKMSKIQDWEDFTRERKEKLNEFCLTGLVWTRGSDTRTTGKGETLVSNGICYRRKPWLQSSNLGKTVEKFFMLLVTYPRNQYSYEF